MSVDPLSFETAAEARRQADAFIAETGGMPEINAAAANLRTAFDKTRADIENATLASRFLREPGDHFKAMTSGVSFSHRAIAAIEQEGEAGHKRAAMLSELDSIEADLGKVTNRLVELRCNLAVSQID